MQSKEQIRALKAAQKTTAILQVNFWSHGSMTIHRPADTRMIIP
jgi:hypothetical protein